VGEVERYPNGTFCWVDLGAVDLDAAKGFYGGLLGWEFQDAPGYTLCRVGGKDVAGMHSHAEEPESGTRWASSIAVDDLDATLGRARDLGATLDVEPFEVPGARLAVITDPSGAQVTLWRDTGFPGARLVNETGTWTWSDLSTRDPEAAGAFYTELFGWEFRQIIPTYWGIGMGPFLIGGMRSMDEDPPGSEPGWVPYFVVEDLEAAQAGVARMGGRILAPPREVPAGRFLVASDPGGAVMGLLEMGPDGPAGGVDRVNPTS
jgi:predicted enzyme related to lactoylglutathione lyase